MADGIEDGGTTRPGDAKPLEEGETSPPGEGNSLQDASEEAVRELERRKDGSGHAGTGDYG